MISDTAKRLLDDDLARLAERGDDLASAVFERWFERAEDAAAMFATIAASTRREMLDATTIAVHDLLEGASWLRWDLAAFGARHEGAYHVATGMYAAYVDAILHGLAVVLGPGFDAGHESAWRAALDVVVQAMHHHADVDRLGALLEAAAHRG